jgi:copper(I)-binding protein
VGRREDGKTDRRGAGQTGSRDVRFEDMRISKSGLSVLVMVACADDPSVEAGRAGDLTVLDAVVLVTAAPDVASLYFTLANHGGVSDTLRGLSASIGTATLHDVVTEGGLTRMRSVGLLTIPSGGEVHLRPGGYHVMVTGLAEPATAGDSVEVRLSLAVNGQVGFWAPVLSFADGMERFER